MTNETNQNVNEDERFTSEDLVTVAGIVIIGALCSIGGVTIVRWHMRKIGDLIRSNDETKLMVESKVKKKTKKKD
jgi:hypothetical protein